MHAPTYTHTDTTYIAPVVVTTKTYELNLATHHYDDGTTLTSYTLHGTGKHAHRLWQGHNIDGAADITTDGEALPAGRYEFRTMGGTPIARKSRPVVFFIAGGMIEAVNV